MVDEVNASIYRDGFSAWHGCRLLAVDGTKTQLPSDPKPRNVFGTSGRNETAQTAQASALYDVLNGTFFDPRLGPMSTGERAMAMSHLGYLRDNFLAIRI
jgi:hypothetical protein